MADNAQGIKAGSAYVALHLDDQMKPALAASKANLDGWAKAVDAAGAQAEKGFAGSIKNILAEQRASGELSLERVIKRGPEGLLGLLGGGLAGAGIDLVAKGIKDAATEASKLADEYYRGDINVADMVNEFGKTLPIVGDIFEAGNAINNLITGQADAIKQLNEEGKITDEIFKAQAESAKEVRKTMREIADEEAQQKNRGANVNADSYQKEENDINAAKAARERAAKDRTDAAVKDATKGLDDEIKAKQAQLKLDQDARDKFVDKYGTDADSFAAAAEDDLTGSTSEDDLWAQYDTLNKSVAASASDVAKATAKRQEVAGNVKAGMADVEKAAQASDDKELSDIDRRRKEDFLKRSVESDRELTELETQAKIALLKSQGDELGAAEVEINAKRDKTIADAQKNAVELGGSLTQAEIARRIAAANEIADAETNAAINSAHESYGAKYEALHQYAEEQAEKSDDANRAADEENEKLEIENTKRGIARIIALDEVERKYALTREADPRTRTGVDPAKINEKYDLMEQIAQMQNRPPIWGSFNSAAIAASTRGSTGADHQEKIVKRLDEGNKILGEIREAVKQSGALGT